MRVTPLALALAFALALVAPLALAQQAATQPMVGAHQTSVGNVTLGYWVGTISSVDENVTANESAALWFMIATNGTARVVAYLNVTSTSDALAIENGTLVLDTAPEARSILEVGVAPRTFADAGVVNMSYSFVGEVFEDVNGTLTLVGPISGSGAFTYDVGALVPRPPAPPGIPTTTWLAAGAAVAVVGGGAALYVMRQRAIQRRMVGEKRRSQVMREIELERKLERVAEKDPEAAAEIRQEIRQQEQVREVRREMQILQAKRADALKTLDLLKKRHEAGGLSKLQYDNMVAKKQADLARIDAEIAQMEREDAGAAA